MTRRLSAAIAVIAAVSGVMAATASATPTAITEPATGLTTTSEQLNGSITTTGPESTYAFEYGTTTGYGSSTPAGELKNAGGPTAVSANITGLQRETTYHYRLVVITWSAKTEAEGVAYGKDVTFTTISGLYLTGEASGEESKQPKFASTNGYPRALVADVAPGTKFTFLKGNGSESTPAAFCTPMPQQSTLWSASSELQLIPNLPETQWKCENMLGQVVTMRTNQCYYTYTLANSGPPYTGSVGIGCKEPSERMELVIGKACTVKLPPQTIESTVKYTETHSGTSAAIETDMATASHAISFEKVGPLCAGFPGNGVKSGYSGGHLLIH